MTAHKNNRQNLLKTGGFVFMQRTNAIKRLSIKICGLIFIAAAAAALHLSGIGCVWKHFFHIPCPGCGMTRAVIAAAHLDFGKMLSYHFMAPSLPLVLLYILFDGRVFRSKRIDNTILIIIGLGFLLHWITEFF